MSSGQVGGRVFGPVEPIGPEPIGPPAVPPENKPVAIGAWMAVLLAGLVLFLAWGAISLVRETQDLYSRSPLIGVLLSILGIAFSATLVWALVREYQAFREINRLDQESRALSESVSRDDAMGVLEALAPRLESLRLLEPDIIAEFEAAARDTTRARRIHELFQNIVLGALDEKADKVIEREAMQTCLAVAILPHPALDAAVVLWKGCGLVRKVSNLYGIRATGLSSLRLLRHVIESAMLAAATETMTEMAAKEGVAGAIGPVIKPLGEAAVTYLRITRLGSFTKQLIVPGFILEAKNRTS